MTVADLPGILVAVLLVAAVIGTLARRHGGYGRRAGTSRPHRARTARCRSGKVAFSTQGDADQVVRRSQGGRRDGYYRPLQRSYRCPHCGHWNTTSQRKRISW